MDAAVGRHRAMLMVVGMLACGVVVGAVLLWPRGEVHRPAADGQQVRFDTTDLTGTTFRAGQHVTLSVQEREGQPPFYNIRDLERTRPMLVLVAVFMLAVVAFVAGK